VIAVDERPGYVLSLRWTDDVELLPLTAHLRRLSARCDVVVVDGSPEPLFRRHARDWAGLVTHLRPPREDDGGTTGVLAGLRATDRERVVLADDTVRCDEESLERVVALLDTADVVVPRSAFAAPLPWHARWDTAGALIDRAVSDDRPAAVAVRRAAVLAAAGGRTDVPSGTPELVRAVRARGGRVVRADDLVVTRLPPSTRRFLGQRVRLAGSGRALPVELAVLPVLAAAARRGLLGRAAAGLALVSWALAETGRRRRGGREAFPASSVALAPCAVAERAVCSWLAVCLRLPRAATRSSRPPVVSAQQQAHREATGDVLEVDPVADLPGREEPHADVDDAVVVPRQVTGERVVEPRPAVGDRAHKTSGRGPEAHADR
jgi:hypothetical protein